MTDKVLVEDAFGVTPQHEQEVREMAELQGELEGELRSEQPKTVVKTKSGGLPLGAKVGMAIFGIIALAGLVLLLLVSNRKTTVQTTERMISQQSSQETNEMQSLRLELAAQKTEIASLQAAQRQLRDLIDRANPAQAVQAVDERINRVEASVKVVAADVASVRKMSKDGGPFVMELFLKEDVSVMSIGNGVARVRERSGKELVLQKGDTWRGLVVRDIRTDRRQVLLSDGSVIQ